MQTELTYMTPKNVVGVQSWKVLDREIGHAAKITSMADWDDVRRIALALPEAT